MKTPLYDRHRNLGAKLVDFCGWEMPLQYTSVLQEHQAVRETVGIFDVSHMGRIFIEGKEGEALLEYLSTNNIIGKAVGTATYTVWCSEDGGCVDDLIVFRLSGEQFFIVTNACNREKDLAHLKKHAEKYNVTIDSRYDSDGILAVQGPKAISLPS